MASSAAPQSIWDSHGFVNTVQINATNGPQTSDIWNKSTGISFVLFMVIGFCATLGAIGLAVAAYLIYRRYRRQRYARQARDLEASAVVPEPKEMYLVVHPGGSADVAHKDLDDSPRKMVLRNKPIQLSSAVLDLHPGNRPLSEGFESEEKARKDAGGKVLNLTASSRIDTSRDNLRASERFQRIRLDSLDASDSPKIMACHPRADGTGLQEQPQDFHQQLDGSSEALSRRSTASETYQDEALLLTPRYTRS